MGRSSEIQNVIGIAPLTPVGTAFNIFRLLHPLPTAPSPAAILPVPGTGRLNRRLFRVALSGFVKPAVDCSVSFSLWSGTDTVIGNNVEIGEIGGAVTAAAGANFAVFFDLIYSTDVGVLSGAKSAIVGGVVNAWSSIYYPSVTGLVDSNEPVMNLVAGASFSVANAAHVAVLDTFAIEA
jgi:hypothetical protein